MLTRLEKYIEVINTDPEVRRIYDAQLPNGQIDIQPGQVVAIPGPVFQRNYRKLWLKRAANVTAKPATQEIPAVEETPAEVAEAVVESESAPTTEVPAEEPEPETPVIETEPEPVPAVEETAEEPEPEKRKPGRPRKAESNETD